MLTNARNLTLADLRQNFGLIPNTADHYFDDWLNHLPPLAPEEITALDRLATNYEYLTESDSPLEEVIKLILQESFWVLVIESKPARIDVTAGIPQILTYLLSAPLNHIPFGMIINGREVLFLRLDLVASALANRSKPQPQYLKSMAYRLLDSSQERSQILQALKHIGQQISEF